MVQLTANEHESLRKRMLEGWSAPVKCSLIINLKGKKVDNDYTAIDDWKGEFGVYRINNSRGRALYIGAADIQDLYTRVSQHLKRSDKGGTFRKRLESIFGSKPKAREYLASKASLQFFSTPANEALVFEALATSELDPEYCGRTWRMKSKEEKAAVEPPTE